MLRFVYRKDRDCDTFESWDGETTLSPLPYNLLDLQKYLMICCQDVEAGGFRDKPPMRKDLYHTFYSLAGLSLSQEFSSAGDFLGVDGNRLATLNPLHGVETTRLKEAKNHFRSLPVSGATSQ
jgi:protein farnesyltransferase subunit beta